jgi:glutathione S-transferase
MSEELGAKTWCSGDHYNLSDIAVGCALGFLDLRLLDVYWRKPYPNLAKLFEKLLQRASFKDTVPPKLTP